MLREGSSIGKRAHLGQSLVKGVVKAFWIIGCLHMDVESINGAKGAYNRYPIKRCIRR
jgi:hypothetical protein